MLKSVGNFAVIYAPSAPPADRLGQLWMDTSVLPGVLNQCIDLDPLTYAAVGGGGGGGGVTDHGALTGLADDDHTQYHTNARGDARYSALGHGHAQSDVTGLATALASKLDTSAASAFGLTLLGDANAAAARTTLGLGTAAVQAATAFESAGAVAAHVAAVDPHPTYLTLPEADLEFAAIVHGHSQSDVTGLVTALAGKSDTGHSHTSVSVTDFAEAVDDRVAALLVAGANVTLTYNDPSNTLTIAASGGGGGTDEYLWLAYGV